MLLRLICFHTLVLTVPPTSESARRQQAQPSLGRNRAGTWQPHALWVLSPKPCKYLKQPIHWLGRVANTIAILVFDIQRDNDTPAPPLPRSHPRGHGSGDGRPAAKRHQAASTAPPIPQNREDGRWARLGHGPSIELDGPHLIGWTFEYRQRANVYLLPIQHCFFSVLDYSDTEPRGHRP